MHATQITIIGGGFCGIMTAIHLMQNHDIALDIHLINKDNPLARGVAYNPHTASLLLNVPNGKISALENEPSHFLNWLINDQPQLAGIANLECMFATRQQYGRYLTCLWNEALKNRPGTVTITTYEDEAYDLQKEDGRFHLFLRHHPMITADVVVLATGNEVPRLPGGVPAAFGNSKRYAGNPWKKDCLENLDPKADLLIIGNGLTMVDTVIGLVEKDFKGKIYTISPNGYQLKPSAETKPIYGDADPKELMKNSPSLLTIVKYINRHRKAAKLKDQSFFKVLDDLRPYNQQIWRSFTTGEKKSFIKHFANMWNTTRHRLPVPMFDLMETLRANGKLLNIKGKIKAITETNNKLLVTLNCGGEIKTISVQRSINCTGPAGDLKFSQNELLQNLAVNGLVCADALGMGINADPENGMVIGAGGDHIPNLFVTGSNLKGILMETTAVPELRLQARKLATHLIENCRMELHPQQM
ncbi:FAD/NAD(P)-binding protein [Mucilaginibacter gotjawali]|uniref:NAD(P)/FAD-binding protein YdhS n=2 Tax=Mucilaginibacter gotjawali TaxID=1550579 RepID=A0A839SLM4_9SPHI|nr:FAD/NAD(P)-binding protein [Mucilaginibacter gotjawali]MBB3058442.1 putative NAD(P)/FAD-binding protein YdhS [Mucilaginibacter gotjawali]BAU53729.1 hypothetical protein MgSA37_01899 [Mucilaginibacter gotjawali]